MARNDEDPANSEWDPVIREDRELLAELARLNTAMAALAMRMMEGSASAAEQHDYAQRLIAAGQRMRTRADETGAVVVDGEVLGHGSLALSPVNGEQRW